MELLTAQELRGRRTGSDESRLAAALLADLLRDFGLVGPFAEGSFCQSFPLFEIHDQNVIGHWLGARPRNGRPVVLLGAHYDGQGVHPGGRVYPGADDNASGVAAWLELARLAAQNATPDDLDLVFVAFGAEEAGRRGSKTYLQQPSVPMERVTLMINLDMVGRVPARGRSLGFLPSQVEGPWVEEMLRRASLETGVQIHNLVGSPASDGIESDADPFRPLVPALHLTTGLHEDHHQLTDSSDRIDYDQIEATVRLVLALLGQLVV